MTMLKYKAKQDGKTYVEVDRFFPSSKTCHVCLNQVGSLSLDVRQWTCDNCQTTHDRDINAAINLRDEGLRILTCGTRDKAYRKGLSPEFDSGACKSRPDVSRGRGGRKKSTTPLSVG